MDKVRILHFPIANSNGGVTRTALKWWDYIDHSRFEFGYATCSKKLYFEKDILNKGCNVHYISCTAEENPEQFCKELRDILLSGYDAIHINTAWWKSFYAERVAKKLGIRVIVVHARACSVEGNTEEEIRKAQEQHEMNKRLFSQDYATHFLACSKEAGAFLFGTQIDKNKIQIFHNAVDVDRYSFNELVRHNTRNELDIDNKFVLGMVGRLVAIKNHEFSLRCLKKICKSIDNVCILIVGDGELMNSLKQKTKEYGIDDKVIFVGSVNDVEKYMNAMDLLLFPSFHEGLGNALIEAQATGLKCVANSNMSSETKVTNDIVYLDLNEELWIEEILKYKNGYIRTSKDREIRDAGYDITQEIKVLEDIYLQASK